MQTKTRDNISAPTASHKPIVSAPVVSSGPPVWGLVRFLLFAAIAILLVLTADNIWISWHDDAELNFSAGTWMALAADLRHGVFYRPLFGPLGYGGTRYFPLHYVLHAALMKAGLNLRTSGHLIEAGSMAMLLVGIFVLLRNLDVPSWLAAASSLAILAAGESQLALTTIRGDVLPAALNVLGLACCARQPLTRRRLVAASLLFTFAFAAKETTIFGAVAATLALLLCRRLRPAVQLGLMTGAGYALVLLSILLASHGRAYELFRASAGAGVSLHNLLVGPYHLVQDATLTWYNPLPNPALYVLGFSALLAWRNDPAASIAPLFLVASTIATVVILGSSGTSYNHLLDLNMAAVITFTAWATRQARQHMTFLTALLASAIIVALPLFWPLLQGEAGSATRQNVHQALQLLRGSPKPVLAENPLVALDARFTPYVLDPYMFGVFNRRDPRYAQPLWDSLAHRSFSEVVLAEDPEAPWGKVWYEKYAFGPGFLTHLNQNYHLAWRGKRTLVYLPDTR